MSKTYHPIGRRELLRTGAVVGGSLLFGAVAGAYKFQIGQGIVADGTVAAPSRNFVLPTPACRDGANATAQVSEGPFYAPAAPHRADLRPQHHAGRELRLSGRVLDTACRPIERAILDFWQTDTDGRYDHFGYEYRGHQLSDTEGRYELLTLLPASYVFLGVSRRRHIHVKVAAPAHRFLTSQIFFPFGQDATVEDFSFDRRLVSLVEETSSRFIEARFDFVLEPL